MFNTKREIEIWLENMALPAFFQGKYKIHDDLSVDFYMNVNISNRELTNFPIKFGKIKGDFNCNYNDLKNLINAPHTVEGIFSCAYNEIESLVGSPNKIYNSFNCSYNKLESLEFSPSFVGVNYDCSYNNLKTLEGIGFIGANLNCIRNNLTNLNKCQNEIYGGLFCDYNELKSFEGCPEKIYNNFSCIGNDLDSMLGGPKYVGQNFLFDDILLLDALNFPEVLGDFHILEKTENILSVYSKEKINNLKEKQKLKQTLELAFNAETKSRSKIGKI